VTSPVCHRLIERLSRIKEIRREDSRAFGQRITLALNFGKRSSRDQQAGALRREQKRKKRSIGIYKWACSIYLAQIAKSMVLGDLLGHPLASIDVCRPLVGVRACWTGENQQGHDRQSENPPRAHDSSSAAATTTTTTIATGCSSFATPAGHRYHPPLYIYVSTTNTTTATVATVPTARQGSSDATVTLPRHRDEYHGRHDAPRLPAIGRVSTAVDGTSQRVPRVFLSVLVFLSLSIPRDPRMRILFFLLLYTRTSG